MTEVKEERTIRRWRRAAHVERAFNAYKRAMEEALLFGESDDDAKDKAANEAARGLIDSIRRTLDPATLRFEDVLPALRAGHDVQPAAWWPDFTRLNRDNASTRTVFVHELLQDGWVVYPIDAPVALGPAAQAQNNCRRCELPRTAQVHNLLFTGSDAHPFVPIEVYDAATADGQKIHGGKDI